MHSLIVANCVRHEEVQPHQFFVIPLASTRSGMEHKECTQALARSVGIAGRNLLAHT